jgi:type IV secretion system protein VirD4
MTEAGVSLSRSIVALFAAIAGFLGWYYLTSVQPVVFEKTAISIAVLGIAAALAFFIAPYGRWRDPAQILAAMTAIAAGVLPLLDIWLLFENAWIIAGQAGEPIQGLMDGLTSFSAYEPAINRAVFFAGIAAVIPLTFVGLEIAGILRANTSDRTSRSGPWQARWMLPSEIQFLKRNRTGLPLGLLGGALLRYEPQPDAGWRGGHHAAIAGTRAGKGVSVVLPAILDHDGPVVVLDVKGENFAVTRRHRKELGRQVAVLNPFGVIEPAQTRFNPLDYVRPDYLVRDIEVVVDGLIRPELGAGAHFSEMAKQLIAAAIEVVITHEDSDRKNLNTVADILQGGNILETLQAWSENEDIVGRRPAQAAATILNAGTNERGGILTTVKKALEWARSDETRAFLEKSDFRLDDLLDDRLDLFIVVPLDQIEAQAVFLRLMVNLTLGTVVRQDGRRKAAKRILLVLDEFVRLGRMEKLLSIANVAAGAGIEALFITQDLGQIETVYGRQDASSILGSCATIRVFGLGRAEFPTAQWAANTLGDQTMLAQSVSKSVGRVDSISSSEQSRKLMTPDQILQIPADEMLMLIASRPPLRIRRIISHTHPLYRKRLDRNPTVRA